MPQLQPSHYLRCEYRVNPLGLGDLRPRLSWEISDQRRGAGQTAYHILAASSVELLRKQKGDLWDSGKIRSAQSIHVPYTGPALASGQRVHWTVRVWDSHGKPSPWAKAAFFEMGLLEADEFKARWIGAALVGGKWTGVPAPYFRKNFQISKPIASARLYATALGVYEFYLNGKRVGEDIFSPGWTDYRRRVQYQVYDVAKLLKRGANAAGAILGDGWYCGFVAADGRQNWGDRPKLLAQLQIEYSDGSTQTVLTDDTWKTTAGPIIQSDFLMGESYDARLEMPGWDTADFDARAWSPVLLFDSPAAKIVPMIGPPVRRHERIKPISEPRKHKISWNQHAQVFDMGQNMVGWVRIRFNGKRGTPVLIKYAEMLNPDGSMYLTNLRSAKSIDHYTLKGGEEFFEPHFTFHGFRYVEIQRYDGELKKGDVTGIVVHSDTPATGSFECSDKLINQLQSNIVWGQKGNFVDVPTDCPQRDERLGWTGDAQVFVSTAALNKDVAGFFNKWTQDLADTQGKGGQIPSFAPSPNPKGDDDGGPAWADAMVICPWAIYQAYGDRDLLEKHYATMVRFVEFLRTSSRKLIRAYDGSHWQGYGDWLSIKAETPNELIGTAFLAYSSRLLGKIAGVLGNKSDAKKYQRLFQEAKEAFIRRFVTPAGLLVSQTQTAYVLALHFDLLPDGLRPAAAAALASNIERRGLHLSTGFVGSPYINHVLTAAGKLDIAYKLLHQKTFPSWLYPVTQGATTIWERWDGWTHDKGFQDPGMNSFNHYAYGAVGAWLYSTVAGIQIDPEHPAYKHVIIHPRPGGELKHARATLRSMYGRIESAWKLDGKYFRLDVTIPANTTATIYVPTSDAKKITESGKAAGRSAGLKFTGMKKGAARYEALAGKYSFSAPRADAKRI